MSRLSKIISGGQTGVDRAALDAAINSNVSCGGYCPKGRIAEDGIIPLHYPLEELSSPYYSQRTLENVKVSDATLIFYFDVLEGGTAKTVQYCRLHQKPMLLINGDQYTTEEALVHFERFMLQYHPKMLNVAGPRHSKTPRAYQYCYDFLIRYLSIIA